jgi:DNA-binding MarR family transcriptional regulator
MKTDQRSDPKVRESVDLEARLANGDHLALRLWLRMLSCSNRVQSAIRNRLRREFGISLARFDLLAQLERMPDGLKMKELSRRLMVTGGNVTGLTDQLEREGFVVRRGDPADRRAYTVKLTPAGRSLFRRMAAKHEQWVVETFDGLSAAEMSRLHRLLGTLKRHVSEPPAAEPMTSEPKKQRRRHGAADERRPRAR